MPGPTYSLVLEADAARENVAWQPKPAAPDLTAEYILGAADAALPNSLVLTAGSGITLTPSGGLMTVAATAGPPNLWPYVTAIVVGAPGTITANGPGFNKLTAGVSFVPWVAGSVIRGMQFAWLAPSSPGPIDVKCSLWTAAGLVATVTLPLLGNITTPIVAVATFGAPYTVLPADVGVPLVISTWAPNGTGGYQTEQTALTPTWTDFPAPPIPILASPLFAYADGSGGAHSYGSVFGLRDTSGVEARPTTVTTAYGAMEPVFA